MDARWTETCVAPRHVDVSRYFPLFSPNEQRGGGGGGSGGGALPVCLFFFHVQQTTSGIGHRVK